MVSNFYDVLYFVVRWACAQLADEVMVKGRLRQIEMSKHLKNLQKLLFVRGRPFSATQLEVH